MVRFTLYNVLLTLFFVFAWTRALNRYFERRIGIVSLCIWTAIWGIGLYLTYRPNKADFVARLLGADNGANAVFTISTIILFYSIYRIYSKLEGQAREINRLNQAISIAQARLEEQVSRNGSSGRNKDKQTQ